MPTVLVAGANRGLGLEFVRQYAADGARVIAGVRDPAKADELNEIAKASGGAITVHKLDTADDGSVSAFKAKVGDQPVDILLAVAGVMGGDRQQQLGDIDFAEWMRTLSVNTLGPARLADAFVDNLRAGQEKKLVAITSGMGSTSESSGGYFAYRSSKAALNNVVRNLSIALRDDRIVCVALNPGWVKTDMGGAGAHITPEQSIAAMKERIARYTMADTGRFLSWDGKQFGW
ncbi:SDR family oxidoreductase [Caulobacter sp. 17J65-9]|uniref:SDR family oxidoreductase n=1 Tax=Caulobacter sp. 17J65-9 TaxID=2709382 RepID=UPI0013C6FDCB|nr:SDR family oxidoreductase [Caulobacter sp. 17J65-9]NEX92148.1 SDR family oxidoreductase [Caulobacter sp. 17J65-9]